MKPKIIPLIFSFFLLLCVFSSSAQALRVKKIHPDTGILTLDDAREVRLAGIHLAPEAFKSLAILFSGQDIELDEEKELAASIPSVYISVKTIEIPFPFKVNTSPQASKLLLNEMLIASGLASVDVSKDFKKKEAYLKLQDEARHLAKGMWSEEPSVKKKS